MRVVPFAVLEEHAREEYRQRFANAPEPKVLNARALAVYDAPRSFVWGGVGYWAPPLSYEDGMRLMIAANALRDLQGAGDRLTSAAITAARLIRAVVDRRRRPLWRLWSRSFYRDTPESLAGLIGYLLHVEDESPVIPSDQRVTVDLVDNRYTFEGHFKRKPDSWADYVYGMRHIGRATSRGDLRLAIGSRVGVNADDEAWRAFEREMRQHSGWN